MRMLQNVLEMFYLPCINTALVSQLEIMVGLVKNGVWIRLRVNVRVLTAASD